MKRYRAALIMCGLLLCWTTNGFADRLYTWTDAKGRTHITQDPPPDTAKVIDTIDYSPRPEKPVRRPSASDRSIQPQGNLEGGGGQARRSPDAAGFTTGEAGNDQEYEYLGGPYRQTLRRYDRRGEWLDNNPPVRSDDLPARVRPRPRMR